MQALRLVSDVSPDGFLNIKIPQEMGTKVEVIILPLMNIEEKDAVSYMKLQEDNGFSKIILGAEEEDVWNEI